MEVYHKYSDQDGLTVFVEAPIAPQAEDGEPIKLERTVEDCERNALRIREHGL